MQFITKNTILNRLSCNEFQKKSKGGFFSERNSEKKSKGGISEKIKGEKKSKFQKKIKTKKEPISLHLAQTLETHL